MRLVSYSMSSLDPQSTQAPMQLYLKPPNNFQLTVMLNLIYFIKQMNKFPLFLFYFHSFMCVKL